MLVLTRKIGEKIIIQTPDNGIIEVVITAIERERVRVGIEADSAVQIWRDELSNKGHEWNRGTD